MSPGKVGLSLLKVQAWLELSQHGSQGLEVLPRFAVLENPQCADDHREEGQVENDEGNDEKEEVQSKVGDDEEENKSVDMVSWDKGADPLHSGAGSPVNQHLLYLDHSMERKLQNLEYHRETEEP